MTETGTKARLLATIDAERAAWQSLVGEIGEERMEEPGPMGGWSFKDLAAHITGWRERTIGRLEAAARGEPEPPPPWPDALTEDDEVNDWIQERGRGRSPASVLAEADDSYARVRAAVAALPDAVLVDPARFPWLEGPSLADSILSGDFFGHWHEEHEPDVRAWLAGAGERSGANAG